MSKSLNGVKTPGMKNTKGINTVVMPVADVVSIVMAQHIGEPCTTMVNIGDNVKVGQVIGNSDALFSAPIHSSVSGTVTEIIDISLLGGSPTKAVVIKTDKQQTIAEGIAAPVITDHTSFVKAVRESGMVGLGGAGFPTHVKFNPPNLSEVETLIINAAECEPYITSDNQTIIEQAEDLIYGIELTMEHMGLKRCIIGIEENKPTAIEKLKQITSGKSKIEVGVLPHLYPQGAEKVIIYQLLDGLVLPEGKLPADVGIVVSNVTTIAELGRFFKTGIPLINKRITVDGSAINKPQNVMVPIGTSVKDLIEFTGGYKGEPAKIIMGGPMMGRSIESDLVPIIKNNNAIIAFGKAEAKTYEETSCIRCAKCMRGCPMKLMPFVMKAATTNIDYDNLKKLKVNLCIECGCCSYVCPANINLVKSHQLGKTFLKKQAAKK